MRFNKGKTVVAEIEMLPLWYSGKDLMFKAKVGLSCEDFMSL